MNEELARDYAQSVIFWNRNYELTGEDREKERAEVNPAEDWKQFAPSPELYDAVSALGAKKNVLDYGCGHGWAGIIAAKHGAQAVTGVDVTENGPEMAAFYAELFGVDGVFKTKTVGTDWLETVPENTYDGLVCSNVLDVVPNEVADNIIRNLARVLTPDGAAVIGLNYYMEPKENPERKLTVKDGNLVFIDGILRLALRTDEQWAESFSPYFEVEALTHFAWPGEQTKRRRLFLLRKRGSVAGC